MKKLCESLREHTMKIVDFEKKKMIPLTSEPQELHKKQKSLTFAKKSSNINTPMTKIIVKLKTTVIILINTEVLHIQYVI